MGEEHVMEVRWTGDAAVAAALKQAAEAHDGVASVDESGDHAVLHVSMKDSDLQRLRDRVDALLVALGDVEEAVNG
ncbi:MAG: hypothetical protein ACPHJD_02935 [Poseidonia sp.]|jgi:hypothetical protein